MTTLKTSTSAVCVAALFAGTAAHADVTAQDVWDSWKESFALYGEDGVTIGSEEMSGDTLTVSDISISVNDPDASIEGDFGSLVLTENGDGTVTVTMPEEITFVFSPSDMINDQERATVALRPGDMTMLVSGTPEAMTFDVESSRYEFELVEILDGGEVIPGEALLAVNGLTGTYAMTGEDLREIDYTLAVASIDMLVDFDIPDELTMLLSGKLENIASEASVAVPMSIGDMDPENPMEAFNAGLAISGGYTFGAMNYIFQFKEGFDEFAGTATGASGELSVNFDRDVISYNTQVTDLAVNFTGSEIPFPVDVSLAQYGIGLTMPISKSDEPSDFAVSVNLTDLAVNDMIWGMVDPQNMLPHDPATLIFEMSGTAKMLFDIMDPGQQMAMAMAPMPAELNSLNLDDLNIDVAGAQLTGGGAFTFDPTDMNTIPGFPRPEGDLSLKLVGGNALIDTLVQMGLVPEEEVMGARMMMGMFATVTGDDQLETTVEINAEGHVLVNGQRVM